jgi:hypothetical protein
MSFVANQSQQKKTVPLIYRFQRLFFAASIVLGTAAILVAAFANPPYYGSSQGIASAIATNATDSNLMDQTHLVFQLIAAYLLPLGFLAMAWLANRRSPWLASIGAFIALLGFLPLALYVGQDSLYYDIARLGSNPQFVDLAQRWNTDGIMNFYGIVFGLGTVFGPTLIGLALWRSRAIPVWAAICLILSRLPVFLFLFVPYHVATAIVLAGTVLLFIGSIPAALAVLKAPHNESQMAVGKQALASTGEESAPTSL